MYQFELKPFRTSQWNPASEWEKEVEKIFDAFSRTNSFSPACEIRDEEKNYLISVDVPGLSKEELEIEVKENQLHVTGERKQKERSEKDSLLRSERRYGRFSRAFTLPQNVNTDAIEARFENGVLEIAIPKEEKAQARKITISDWKRESIPTDLKN